MSLRFVLLALLSKGPNTGYRLGRLLQGELNHLWDARLQQIYSELAKLHADGLLETECVELPNRPAKKIYSLTTTACQKLDAWLGDLTELHLPREPLLVRLFCVDRISPQTAARILETRRDQYEQKAHEFRERLANVQRTNPDELGHLLSLDGALAEADAGLAWCNRALSGLQGQDAQELPRPLREPRDRAAGA